MSVPSKSKKEQAPQGINAIKLVVDNPESASYIALQQSVIKDKEAKILKLETKVSRLASKIVTSEEQADDLSIQVANLQDQLKQLSKPEIISLVDEDTLKQIETLSEELIEVELALELSNAKVTSLSNSKLAINSQLETARNKASTTNARIQFLENQNEKPENQLLSNECSDNAFELEELREKVLILTKDVERLTVELSGEPERRKNYLSLELAKFKPVVTKDNEHTKSLELEILKLQQENLTHKDKLQEFNSENMRLNSALKKNQDTIKSLTDRPIELLEQMTYMAEQGLALNKEKESLISRLKNATADSVYYQNIYQAEKGNADRLANIVGLVEKNNHLDLEETLIYYLSNSTHLMKGYEDAKYPLYLAINKLTSNSNIIFWYNDEIKVTNGENITFDDPKEMDQVKTFLVRHESEWIKNHLQLGLKAAMTFGDVGYRTIPSEHQERVINTAKSIAGDKYLKQPEAVKQARKDMERWIAVFAKEIAMLHGLSDPALAASRSSLIKKNKVKTTKKRKVRK